jgi:hypothetical protein
MQYRRLALEGDALVVTFDMCSSTTVVEELTLCGALNRYDALVTAVKEHLAAAQQKVLFAPYKFSGDGWILLFPAAVNGQSVFGVLQDLCRFYKGAVEHEILRHLPSRPAVTGLTFGIEKGPLRPMTVYGQREYIGRALNAACRLQAAIKDNDKSPAYKALVSNAAFNDYFAFVPRLVKVWDVKRTLRNIRGGSDFYCKKIEFLNVPPDIGLQPAVVEASPSARA